MAMKILIIDPTTSGAAGDLLIAALLDSQTEAFRTEFCQLFQNLLKEYDPEFQVKWSTIKKQAISGTQIQTSAIKKFSPNDLDNILENLCKQLELDPKSRNMTKTAFKYLVDAEKKVHGLNDHSESIHFHELATIDTVFDIIGFVYLWETLGFLQIEVDVLPIAVGGGLINISHGQVSVPTPATTEIIRNGGLVIKGGPINGELLTPTGAAILASINAIPLNYLPLMDIHRVGRSFGTRDYEKGTLTCLQIIQ